MEGSKTQIMISAVILTKNQSDKLDECIKSLEWCDELIIIEDFNNNLSLRGAKRRGNLSTSSSSHSRAIPRLGNSDGYPLARDDKKKIKVFQRYLNKNFAEQRNFGLEKAKGEWILFIDDDEIISEELASEIKYQISDIKYHFQAYYLKRQDYFLGRWLKYGETGNARFIRLAKKGSGVWKGEVHEVWEINGDAGDLKNPILHYPHGDIFNFLEKINLYTDLVAEKWKSEGRKITSWKIILYPAGKFFQNYFIRLGILDGIPGLIMATMMSLHSFLARAKNWYEK